MEKRFSLGDLGMCNSSTIETDFLRAGLFHDNSASLNVTRFGDEDIGVVSCSCADGVGVCTTNVSPILFSEGFSVRDMRIDGVCALVFSAGFVGVKLLSGSASNLFLSATTIGCDSLVVVPFS